MPTSEDEVTPPRQEMLPRDEAITLVKDFIEADADLSKHVWLEKDPFYVGTWQGYVRHCDDKGLVHLGGFGGDVSRFTIVAYRMAFTPAGGGREDFFLIDPETKLVRHVKGLVGR
jgi:hypothetical protein